MSSPFLFFHSESAPTVNLSKLLAIWQYKQRYLSYWPAFVFVSFRTSSLALFLRKTKVLIYPPPIIFMHKHVRIVRTHLEVIFVFDQQIGLLQLNIGINTLGYVGTGASPDYHLEWLKAHTHTQVQRTLYMYKQDRAGTQSTYAHNSSAITSRTICHGTKCTYV